MVAGAAANGGARESVARSTSCVGASGGLADSATQAARCWQTVVATVGIPGEFFPIAQTAQWREVPAVEGGKTCETV